MAIIYTYPRLTNPDGTELVVVSETSNQNATRLIALSDIAALVPSTAGGTITSVTVDFASNAIDTGLRLYSGVTFTDVRQTYNAGAATFEVGGTLNANFGGTGQNTYTKGDMLYYQELQPEKLEILNIGFAGEVLTVGAISGIPEWLPSTAIPVDSVSGAVVSPSAGVAFDVAPTTGNVVATAYQYAGGALVGYVPPGGLAGEYLEGIGSFTTPPNDNWTYSLVTPGASTGTGIPIQLTSPDTATTSIELREGTNVTLSTTPGQITINAAGAVGPAKTNYDDTLAFRGSAGGVITPLNFVINKAHYWIFGDYVYLEFYMEFTQLQIGSMSGDMIMTDLPPLGTIAPIGAAEEQGSCLVTRNDGLGSVTGPAPKVGRTGINASDEVLFKTTNDSLYGVYVNAQWDNRDGDYSAGNFTLAGTIQWAH
tara:strand:+ start:227 stop:1501 length:1275 start_codon:yes stop_codon:yes gene_type:complete